MVGPQLTELTEYRANQNLCVSAPPHAMINHHLKKIMPPIGTEYTSLDICMILLPDFAN